MTSSASSSGGVCGSKESLAQLLGFLMMKPGDRSHRWLLAASLQVKKRHVSVLTAALWESLMTFFQAARKPHP